MCEKNCECETVNTVHWFGHPRSFKVIHFGVNEEPLRGYIVYNIIIVALNVKVRKI